MSWQATGWAVRQKVGPPARKLLLLVIANYADADGIAWPSQARLAEETGMSLDTVQRQTKRLCADGFLSITRPPKRRGQWQAFVYQLSMADQPTKPQNAARPEPASEPAAERLALAASEGQCGPAGPHPARKPGRTAMRLKPSIEPSTEPLRARTSPTDAAERLRAFQGKQEPTEVTQNRIARRLGPEGWMILGELSDAERDRLTALERGRALDDATLAQAALNARLAQPPDGIGGGSKV